MVNSSEIQERQPTAREQWETETTFRDRELAIKERELNIKEREVDIQGEEHNTSKWSNPLVIAILAGTVAALGNTTVSFINGMQQRVLEHEKAEQARILEMVKTGDTEKAATNLKFLLEAGLITNPEIAPQMGMYLKNRKPGEGPNLPSASNLSNFTSRNIGDVKLLQETESHPYSGFWKSDCNNNFGVAIGEAGPNEYFVSFSGPGGTFDEGEWSPNTSLVGDPDYKIISPTHIQIRGREGFKSLYKCSPEK